MPGCGYRTEVKVRKKIILSVWHWAYRCVNFIRGSVLFCSVLLFLYRHASTVGKNGRPAASRSIFIFILFCWQEGQHVVCFGYEVPLFPSVVRVVANMVNSRQTAGSGGSQVYLTAEPGRWHNDSIL